MSRRPFLLLTLLLSLVALGFLALSSAAASWGPLSPGPRVPASSPVDPFYHQPRTASRSSSRLAILPSSLAVSPSLPSPYAGEEQAAIAHYEIVITETWVTEPISSVNLYARLVMPDPALYPGQHFPAVVLVPGGTGAGAPSAGAAEYRALAQQGMIVVAWNAPGRGSGLPGDLKSEGVETCNGFAGQNALKSIIEYTAGLVNVDTTNIGVHTSSYGITIGAGALGRYPTLPVRYLVDMEGPSNNLITTFYYGPQEHPMCGHYSVVSDTSPANLAWWVEREAYRYIGAFDGYYLRAQAVTDHAQPAGVYTHTIEMIHAAVDGGVPWVRVNGLEMGNDIDIFYDPDRILWLPGRLRDWAGLNAAHIADMARRFGANVTPVWDTGLRLPHDVDRLENGHTLITDGSAPVGKLLEVDADGNVVALYLGALSFAHNADREAGGSTWISDTGHDRVLELESDNRTTWDSDWHELSDGSVLHYPNDANLLANGHILITDRDNHRVLEIDRPATVLWQFGMTGVPGNDDTHLDGPHNADRLDNGNTLIVDSNNDRVVEVDGDRIVWQVAAGLAWPRDADRLANGNTLIVDSNHDRIVEVTPAGYVAWQYAAGLSQPYDADRLANGNTLIADSGHGRVIEVDPAGRVVWAFPPGATELGFVLVTERAGTTVDKIDPLTDQIVGQVSVGTQPSGMVVDYDRRWAYVAVEGTDNVSAIRADTLEAVNLDVAGLGGLPIGLALTSDGQRLLVTTRGDDGVISADDRLDVVALDTADWPPSGALITSVPTGLHPINVVVSNDDHYAVVTVRNQPDIFILDLETYTIVAHAPGLPSGAEPEGLDIHPTANVAYATLHGIMSTVEVIDLDTLSFVRHVPIIYTPPARPSTGVFTPDGSRFYVSGQSVNRVFLFDVTDPLSPTQNMGVVLQVGPQPHFMAFMPGDRAYVANTNNGQPTGSLSIINNYSGDPTVSGPILPTLAGPIRLAYFPEQCRPLETLALDGPLNLLVGETGWYTASYTPISATTPVTITWDHGAVGSFAAYSWTQPGVYTFTVTATNGCGEARGALLVTVLAQCEPVEEVAVTGPLSLLAGESGLFTASYSPLTATWPVTLTWDNGAMGPTAGYSWTDPGRYTVTVTVTNPCGVRVGLLPVRVLEIPLPCCGYYLPVVVKSTAP